MTIHRIERLMRANERLLGFWWCWADDRWDTVHRIRLGLGITTIELAWWSRKAWRGLKEKRMNQ